MTAKNNRTKPDCKLSARIRKDIDKKIELLNKLPKSEDFYQCIGEYNALVEQWNEYTHKYRVLKDSIIKVNSLYDGFKREFSDIVEKPSWGDKLYFALTILDDYKDLPWDNQWCEQIINALSSENRNKMRIYINQQLDSCIFTLPQGLYFYRLKEEKSKGAKDNVVATAKSFAPRVIQFFRSLLATSDSLREPLIKIIQRQESLKIPVINVVPFDMINSYLAILGSYSDNEKKYDSTEIDKLNKNLKEVSQSLNQVDIIEDFDAFQVQCRELYQQTQTLKSEVESLHKGLYIRGLDNVYKLYDYVLISLNDFRKLIVEVNEDNITMSYLNIFIHMLSELRNCICEYLYISLSIRPLEIEEGKAWDSYPENYCDVLDAIESTEYDNDIICKISNTGFGIFNGDELRSVFRSAKVIVYRRVEA